MTATRPIASAPWKRQLPLISVIRRIRATETSLTPSARLVAIMIADAMGPDGPRQATFLGEKEIARRTGLSQRTVRRCLKELAEMPVPLFRRTLGGTTRRIRHRCYRFELIESVVAFQSAAKQRQVERQRATEQEQAKRQLERLDALLAVRRGS